MDDFDDQEFELCKWFLKIIGLWPQQTNVRRRLSAFIYAIIHLALLFSLIMRLKEDWSDYKIRCVNIVGIVAFSLSLIRYFMSFFDVNRIKLILVKVQKNKRKITDRLELEIWYKYNQEGRKLSIFYTAYTFFGSILFSFLPLTPHVLDIVLPLENGTRPLWIHFYLDCTLFDQTYHNGLVNIYIFVMYGIFSFLTCGLDLVFMMAVKYTCGLFAIACDRIFNIVKINKNQDISTSNKTVIQKNLAEAVDLHNECIRSCYLIENVFSTFQLLIQVIAIIGFSSGLISILQLSSDVFYLIRGIIIYLGGMIYLYIFNWFGQLIIDGSEEVFTSTYFSKWYYAPVSIQKSTIMPMLLSLRPCNLTRGKLIILSMRSFEMVLKTSFSFFTVFLTLM